MEQRERGGARQGELSDEIVSRVSDRLHVDPTALPPLYESFDPDALDALFESTGAGEAREGRVSVTYCGFEITVAFEDDGRSLEFEERPEVRDASFC